MVAEGALGRRLGKSRMSADLSPPTQEYRPPFDDPRVYYGLSKLYGTKKSNREDQEKVGEVKNRGMWEMARNKRTIRMKPTAAARGRAYRRLR